MKSTPTFLYVLDLRVVVVVLSEEGKCAVVKERFGFILLEFEFFYLRGGGIAFDLDLKIPLSGLNKNPFLGVKGEMVWRGGLMLVCALAVIGRVVYF